MALRYSEGQVQGTTSRHGLFIFSLFPLRHLVKSCVNQSTVFRPSASSSPSSAFTDLKNKLSVSFILDKCSTAELWPQPFWGAQIKPRHSCVFSFQFLFSFEYETSPQTFRGVSIFPKPHPAARCWPISSEGCPLGQRILVMFTSSAPYTSVDV